MTQYRNMGGQNAGMRSLAEEGFVGHLEAIY
jgi:hypothetical protein